MVQLGGVLGLLLVSIASNKIKPKGNEKAFAKISKDMPESKKDVLLFFKNIQGLIFAVKDLIKKFISYGFRINTNKK